MFEEADAAVETHISWVFFAGDLAYKRKKPVRTAFLDFSTAAARKWACEEEVRVNRRLAPDVYLGVEEIPGPDWVVVMRRMPDDRRLSQLIARGEHVGLGLREVARRVAALHLRCGRAPATDAAASSAAALQRWESNHAEITPFAALLAEPRAAERALTLARRYAAGRDALFAQRVAAGRAVDGHGDLLADDIFLLPDGPRILDAIEFDPGLRAGDGLADVAFLAMDLERLGSPADGRRFLDWYAAFTADRWPDSLARFYIAYRAQVRAKVALIRAAQQGGRDAPDADALLALAVRHLEAGRVTLIVVGGPPATGKTSIARLLGADRHSVVLRSDEVRKELIGISADTSAAAPLMAGVYTPAMTSLTYGEILHQAAELLERGESVILDATWGDPTWRAEARRLADRAAAVLIELRCDAPVELSAQRARTRRLDASDAGADVAIGLAERFAPWPEATVVDTTGTPAASATLARAAVKDLLEERAGVRSARS